MLERAAEWFESRRLKSLSVPVVYVRRDGGTIQLDATPGRTLFRAENEYGVTVRTESRDFLVAVSGLPDDPGRGDRILHAGRLYEVLAPNGEPVWRWCGPYHRTRRIHTKEIGGT